MCTEARLHKSWWSHSVQLANTVVTCWTQSLRKSCNCELVWPLLSSLSFFSFHLGCSFYFMDYKLCGTHSDNSPAILQAPLEEEYTVNLTNTTLNCSMYTEYSGNFLTIQDLACYDSLNPKQPVFQAKDWVVMLSTEYLPVNSHQSLSAPNFNILCNVSVLTDLL